MKKLLLITFLFLITPDAKADMDYVCKTQYQTYMYDYIKSNCERNNIFLLRDIPQQYLIDAIAFWCRQDRETNYKLQENLEYHLSCVLYDSEPRKPVGF